MYKFILFNLIGLSLVYSSSVQAQTPARNLMPDGSRDMYIGLGLIQRPSFEGAETKKELALPIVQMQWSNGVFLAGMSAGIHLSEDPQLEYGALLMLAPKRTESGISGSVDIVAGSGVSSEFTFLPMSKNNNPLLGLDKIKPRLLGAGFLHKHINEQLVLTNTLSYGYGNERNGARLSSDLRFQLNDFLPHHSLILSTGLNFVNKEYNQAYFGISSNEAARTKRVVYQASGGVKDIHADLQWNWKWSSSWMLISKVNTTRLIGSASKSPLVTQKNQYTISSAIAYRF